MRVRGGPHLTAAGGAMPGCGGGVVDGMLVTALYRSASPYRNRRGRAGAPGLGAAAAEAADTAWVAEAADAAAAAEAVDGTGGGSAAAVATASTVGEARGRPVATASCERRLMARACHRARASVSTVSFPSSTRWLRAAAAAVLLVLVASAVTAASCGLSP